LVKRLQASLGDTFLGADGHYESLHGKSAYAIIDPAEGADPIEVELRFDPGQTVSGTVLTPDGKPAAGVMGYKLTATYDRPAKLKDGTFTAAALDPAHPRTATFVDTDRKLAAAVTLKGDEKGPVVVTLKPWAVVTGRLVGEDGKPLAGAEVALRFTEGGLDAGYRAATGDRTAKADADGRFRLDVPFGDTAFVIGFGYKDRPIRRGTIEGIKVPAGETKDLGDITLQTQE
jgi:hypothetical protein